MTAKQNSGEDVKPLKTGGVCESPLATRPILYTDTIKGEQVCRDDMWAVTTEELNLLQQSLTASESLLREAEEFVDRHSEPWYTSGQKLLADIRAQLEKANG